MSTGLERRYRRVLRLLPAGYRYRWEEEMVSAFIESASAPEAHAGRKTSRRSALGEQLSVVALAVRLRLNGAHATPRGLAWYEAAYGLGLMVLLYQAIAATISVAMAIRYLVEFAAFAEGTEWVGPVFRDFYLWSKALNLLWVAAFACLALGRLVAARVLVVLALVATIGTTVTIYAMNPLPPGTAIPIDLAELSRWGWLAVSVGIVFVPAPEPRVSRPFWLSAYLVGAVALVLTNPNVFAPSWPWIGFVTLHDVAATALIIGMAVALLGAWIGRRRSPRWLLALAVFAGGFGTVRLLRTLNGEPWPMRAPRNAFEATALDVTAVSLALVCAIVGLLALRRLPGRRRPQPGELARDSR